MSEPREILFRGKRMDNGEFVYGYYAGDCGDGCHEIYNINSPFGLRVVPSTIGQYTGMRDKNGQRIFEGDIIRTHYVNAKIADFVEQVMFHNGRFCGMYEKGTVKAFAALPDGVPHIPGDKSVYMDWCEVIGNIHDNPELLEEEAADAT